MPVGILTVTLHFPGCLSLKEKRGRLKPLLTRLHREFNISVAETGFQDVWRSAQIECVMVGTDQGQIDKSLHLILRWLETNWPDTDVVDDHYELAF